jgi:hypothetical protein
VVVTPYPSTNPKVYESKPSRIEAVQWTGKNFTELMAFAPVDYEDDDHDPACYLSAGKDGAQDYVPVPVGHWIVRAEGDDSDYWPVDADYFAAKYQEAGEAETEEGAATEYVCTCTWDGCLEAECAACRNLDPEEHCPECPCCTGWEEDGG